VLSHRTLVDAPGLLVAEVTCPGHGTRWSAPEPVTAFGIVLVRRGAYRRRVRGRESVVDPGTAYLQLPGTEHEIAHPAGADLCTSITLDTITLDSITLDSITLDTAEQELPSRLDPIQLDPRVGLAHRMLLARADAGADRVTLTDLAAELTGTVLAVMSRDRQADRRPADRRLTDAARELMAFDPDRPLPELARRLAVSPYHLSRVFHRVCGVTLSRYRIRLRTDAALERLSAGEPGLAALAADLGFADQAHLTRTLRAETGLAPGQVRALLATPSPSVRARPRGQVAAV
jgi:AraC-like DNA-binding protein